MLIISTTDSWSALELRHLVALAAIASEGSFGKAARSLGYTQSAVSQQIASLERIVGSQLLDRPGGPRPVTLTESGELLLKHADAIRARLQAARADFDALATGRTGTLRVGTYQSVGSAIVPAVLGRLRADWPDITVELREATGDQELVDAVERGELDLSFTVVPLLEGPLESRTVLVDPRVLIVAPDSPFAKLEAAPSYDELRDEPMISFKDTCCRDVLLTTEEMAAAGFQQRIVFRTEDNGTLQGLVAAGMGSAIVPRLVVDAARDDVVVIPFGDVLSPRQIAIVWHSERYRPPAADAFVQCTADVCDELTGVPTPA
ncbi:MAG: LysR family transcriptional regulator [Gaiellaceae bacterium]